MQNKADFERRIQRIDELVHQLEALSDASARALAGELVQSVMDLHEGAIEHLMETIADAGDSGRRIIDRLGREEPVRSLLLLYGLHPVGVQERVRLALDKTRPYLKSHGGDVQLLGIDDSGTVRLRLQGSCDGCPSSALTLKMAIEEAIREAAPDVIQIAVENDLVTLDAGDSRLDGVEKVDWKEIDTLGSLQPGGALVLDVYEEPIFFCRLEDTFYAYGSTCPACLQRMRAEGLDGPALTCTECGQRYDVVQAGRGLDRPKIHLNPFPLLVENGRARVALPLTPAEGTAT